MKLTKMALAAFLLLPSLADTLHAQIIVDPSFERDPVGTQVGGVGLFFNNTGEWTIDRGFIRGSENGIIPFDGNQMLFFDANIGNTANVYQLVDLAPFAGAIAAQQARANFSAFFNATDSHEFFINFLAYDESALPINVENFFNVANIPLTSDSDASTWEQLTAEYLIPLNARFLAVGLNSERGGVAYADQVSLSITGGAEPGRVEINSSDNATAQFITGSVAEQLAEINSAPTIVNFLQVNRHSDFHSPASFDCNNPPAPPLELPYVSTNNFLDGADEITLDNCSSAWYRFTFELPPNFTNAILNGSANVDDVAVLYLNGNRISASVLASDLGEDRTLEGQQVLSWPTTDAFSCDDNDCFQPGVNELVFGVHGDLSDFEPTGLEFVASVKFDRELGDVNQDGVVNFLDIAPFITILTTGGFLAEADTNQDGVVNFLDISPFITLLSS